MKRKHKYWNKLITLANHLSQNNEKYICIHNLLTHIETTYADPFVF